MNHFEIVLTIMAAVSVIGVSIAAIIPALKKKGVNAERVLNTAQAGLVTADTVVDSVKRLFPTLPGLNLVDTIIEWAQKGAEKAEQLYKVSQINASQRKESAVQLVKDCLMTANITITPEIVSIIDGCVEAAVFSLPKSNTTVDSAAPEPDSTGSPDADETAAGAETPETAGEPLAAEASVTGDVSASTDTPATDEPQPSTDTVSALTVAASTLTAATAILSNAVNTISGFS